MAAFIKSLTRLLSASASNRAALHLAAFGKHPGWNDHLDDLGLDTDALIAAKRLLYVQGISQNIDSGAWDKLDQTVEIETSAPVPLSDAAASGASVAVAAPPTPTNAIGRLDLFRHDFIWSMPPLLLAGRLWSSSDGKGRAKYPMVLCSQLTDLPDRFATDIVLPFLVGVHQQCAAATTADAVRQIMNTERENLRSHLKDSLTLRPINPRQLADVARHPDMHAAPAASSMDATAPAAPDPAGGGSGFHRIVYQFLRGLSAFRTPPAKNAPPRRPEHLRLPACGMSVQDALLFWMRFALTLLDASTPLLLFAPETEPGRNSFAPPPWIDLIAGEPSPANLFCIKAGTKSLPFTSDIPYTLEMPFVRAIDTHIAHCASMPETSPLPAWPDFGN